MQPGKTTGSNDERNTSSNEPKQPNEKTQSTEDNTAAFQTAEDDIAKDPELSTQSPNDDLDEGETARLGEDENDLV